MIQKRSKTLTLFLFLFLGKKIGPSIAPIWILCRSLGFFCDSSQKWSNGLEKPAISIACHYLRCQFSVNFRGSNLKPTKYVHVVGTFDFCIAGFH